MRLTFNHPNIPGTPWGRFAAMLNEDAGWVFQATMTPPSRSQFQAVLASITNLPIRSEFQVGFDTGWLDNPALVELLPGAGMAPLTSTRSVSAWRRPGSVP